VRHPVLDPVPQPPGDRFCIPDKRVHRGTVRPAAALLQLLGKVPVIERRKRTYPPRKKRVHQAFVEIESLRVEGAVPFGIDPRPGNGEPIDLEAEILHEVEVGTVAVVMIARHAAVIAVCGLPRGAGKPIPDGLAFPVFVLRPFDLICSSRRPPDEPVGKTEKIAVGHDHPFSAPAVTPAMIRFEKKK